MLTKEQILAVKPKVVEVEVPEWGGTVFVRPVTLREQGKLADLGNKYEKTSIEARLKNCTLQLLEWAVCDKDGNRAFSIEDFLQMWEVTPASAFLRLQESILRISGLTKESREELEKNLLTAPASVTAS